MTGSLVLLSDAEMNNFFFATVLSVPSEEKLEKLQSSLSPIPISLLLPACSVSLATLQALLHLPLLMLENKNFYESFFPFMNNILQIKQLPFQENIVGGGEQVGQPGYLRNGQVYRVDLGDGIKKVEVMGQWPESAKAGLDES
jgi:hypothetical protein